MIPRRPLPYEQAVVVVEVEPWRGKLLTHLTGGRSSCTERVFEISQQRPGYVDVMILYIVKKYEIEDFVL
jgi:hypothetical protein